MSDEDGQLRDAFLWRRYSDRSILRRRGSIASYWCEEPKLKNCVQLGLGE